MPRPRCRDRAPGWRSDRGARPARPRCSTPARRAARTGATAARAAGTRRARGAARARAGRSAPGSARPAASSASTPLPVVASVFTIGGRHSPCAERVQRQHRLDRRDHPIGAFVVRLVDHEDVGDLHDAGLERLHLVAGARHQRHDRDVGGAHDVHLVLADADGLDQHDVLAGGVEHRARRRSVARARPPRWPRVAMLRMNTPLSPACACMRTRSPRIAPPLNGLVGSTAIMPTVWPAPRSAAIRRSTSVLLPAPGGPVTPRY